MTETSLSLNFQTIQEFHPGVKLQTLFNSKWPAYQSWFLKQGEAERPSYTVCRRMLRRYMPELTPTYDRLIELAVGGDHAARFLALYCPPPVILGCSQAAWTRDRVALIRNYDYPPSLCEGVMLHSAWQGTEVIAMTDCLWGVLDGMNNQGLAVSLAFGGRQAVGKGFAVTLILRYLLETCTSVRQAVAVLKRVPVNMAYNIGLVDRSGAASTVYIGPDRRPEVLSNPFSANRQGEGEWPEYDLFSWSALREQVLGGVYQQGDLRFSSLLRTFLRPPLYRTCYQLGWGTVYTSAYYPESGRVECRWPDATVTQSFSDFQELTFSRHYVPAPELPVMAILDK